METRLPATKKRIFKPPARKVFSKTKPNVFKLLEQGKGGNPQGGNPAKGGEESPENLIPGIQPNQPIPGKGGPDPDPIYSENSDGKQEDPNYTAPSGGTPWGWIIGGILGVGAIGYFAFGGKKKKRK